MTADTDVLLAYADLALDVPARQATRSGRLIRLTPTEYGLLEMLLHHPGRVMSRDVIQTRARGHEMSSAQRALNQAIFQLRRKTEAGGEPRLIQTVRGVGFVLREGS